jgi:glyoxylase-like metal-dependent hydrolase (beta-lactamase superfamily II)
MKNNIIQVNMGHSNAYLISSNSGYILVDAGVKGKEKNIKEVLKKNNATLDDIELMIITHVHYDHVGSLKTLKSLTNAKVMVHRKAYESLASGISGFPIGTMKFSKVISKIANKFTKGEFEGIEADILIDDTYDLRKFGINGEVIYTPGHTIGSICILVEDEHLICGDTFFNVFSNSVYPPFANLEKELLKSWIRIKEKDPKLFYPGHGDVFYKGKFVKTLEERIIH